MNRPGPERSARIKHRARRQRPLRRADQQPEKPAQHREIITRQRRKYNTEYHDSAAPDVRVHSQRNQRIAEKYFHRRRIQPRQNERYQQLARSERKNRRSWERENF